MLALPSFGSFHIHESDRQDAVVFTEKELKEVDIERELTYRRFIICPDYGHVTLVTKAEEEKHGNKSISVSIDFNEGQFLVIKNSGEVIPTVSSFNDILLGAYS